ncbi:hypothetical protein Bca52824_033599 [Brassica carinata]|uniref:Uncharacterized protein n=1 Tax=Brassica carinata TaxID=52824 RepID=A0A8X7SER8_BRACI|nr:hypothetical protein Bca52824_033599 [Brassica carinata]
MSLAHRKQLGVVGGLSTAKRSQNTAAKAAAQRLAKVMALQNKNNGDEEARKTRMKISASDSHLLL